MLTFFSKMVQKNPYSWFFAWGMVHRVGFLLPHDSDYKGLKLLDSKEGVFLDVGANDGISALSFRKVNNKTPIISLEPFSFHEKALRKLESQLDNFHYKLVGASNKERKQKIFVPVYSGIFLHTFASMSQALVKENIQKSFGKKILNKVDIKEFSAQFAPIDSLNLVPSIIKIDVEGFSYEVIKGAERTIDLYRPSLMIEVEESTIEKLLSFFSQKTYSPFVYVNKKNSFSPYTLGLKNKNVFFIPQEKI